MDDDSQCVEFPPEGGYIYWAYFHTTSPNAPWEYSQWGVLNRDPALNSVEGWRWGTGKEQPNNGTVPPYHVEPSPEPTTPEPTSPEPTGPVADAGFATDGTDGRTAVAALAGLLALIAGGALTASNLVRR
ncbi:hypothetical protein BJF82_11545 [Kytococcus sp. CUA-901]|nr:hypothetical protein BJF82_11545 [Kytococcus sp. CUA-901]